MSESLIQKRQGSETIWKLIQAGTGEVQKTASHPFHLGQNHYANQILESIDIVVCNYPGTGIAYRYNDNNIQFEKVSANTFRLIVRGHNAHSHEKARQHALNNLHSTVKRASLSDRIYFLFHGTLRRD